ncbi:hypothetical protein [Borrelia hermsii]|uniref:Uncharacterized protein n=3 Tax=Borrelia hermsii TaxID=140 RepID=A0AAN0X4X8_BORHE|nr:hypothetical protein [Borrelia hermsii]AAX17236.1 hypothetical protein BH0735B [Borrelia hermsii DAH]AJW73519.1 hypothetical protein L283_03710 [Borrelia hermsii CC1]AMR75128.1 hypothetical protein A0V01_00595 [Borrelia hermsii]ANA43535.1 hypothetical protein AXX13_03725 [Borrelia hermsii HS1]UCP01730.1 hypothetical protein K9R62_03765 [Borrelia hermsii]
MTRNNNDNLEQDFKQSLVHSNSKLKEFTKNIYKNIFREEIKKNVYSAVLGLVITTISRTNFFKTISAKLTETSTMPEIRGKVYLKMNTAIISNIINMKKMQKESLNHKKVKINSAKYIKIYKIINKDTY